MRDLHKFSDSKLSYKYVQLVIRVASHKDTGMDALQYKIKEIANALRFL